MAKGIARVITSTMDQRAYGPPITEQTISNFEELMTVPKPVLFILILTLIFFFHPAPAASSQTKSTTERQCALTKDAEIIWDMSENRWVCCVPEDEALETCIPITDMKPLKKTSLRPLPPPGKKTVVVPAE